MHKKLNNFIFTPSTFSDGVMCFFSFKIKQLYYHYTKIYPHVTSFTARNWVLQYVTKLYKDGHVERSNILSNKNRKSTKRYSFSILFLCLKSEPILTFSQPLHPHFIHPYLLFSIPYQIFEFLFPLDLFLVFKIFDLSLT